MAKPRTLLEQALGDRFVPLYADPVAFVSAFDREPWEYQAGALRRVLSQELAGDSLRFENRVAVVSWPRQDGKSTLNTWAALWRFYCDPTCSEIVSVALDRDSARIILNDARRIISGSGVLMDLVDDRFGLGKSEITLKDGRRWLIKSADAVYSRGLRPSHVTFDELGWTADDGDLLHTLLAGQAAQVNPLCLVTSTVGPIQAGPLWELMQGDDPDVLVLWHSLNKSPLVTEKFLEGERRKLPASWYAREHENTWGEGSDAFCSLSDWEAATEGPDPRRNYDPGPGTLFVDLGWVHDETAIATAKSEDGKTVITSLEAFRGSQKAPLQLATIQDAIEDICERLHVTKAEIESPQGVLMQQQLKAKGVNVTALHPTSKSNSERWGALYLALKNHTVRLPKDERLRRQLLSLTIRRIGDRLACGGRSEHPSGPGGSRRRGATSCGPTRADVGIGHCGGHALYRPQPDERRREEAAIPAPEVRPDGFLSRAQHPRQRGPNRALRAKSL